MGPEVLGQVLRSLSPSKDPNLLVGIETGDDAAVYRLSDDKALVQTIDVFTPVVDDPYLFGQIAAANSLSDIYAMGGRPLFALSFIGFPIDRLPLDVMKSILRGGEDKAREAGIEIVGGHSLKDDDPKYGLSVTGIVDPRRVIRNSTARPGDQLVLTKPLGSGVLTAAIKKGVLDETGAGRVGAVMAELNRGASEAMIESGASACTDVTGFGL
ncbi:MAG: selenide, water dikinase SelD, partial [Vicinamibacteria bacterium]